MNDASNHGRSGPFWVVWRPGGEALLAAAG
jgi:hypothetical protein